MPTESEQPKTESPKSSLAALHWELDRAKRFLSRVDLPAGYPRISIGSMRRELGKLLGEDSPVVNSIVLPETTEPREILRKKLHIQSERLELFLRSIDTATNRAFPQSGPPIVFLGHGRSPVWREVKDFIVDRLKLSWEEFNRESVAGTTTSARLEEMLSRSHFAFLIMTAEDLHADSQLHARENVVHEVGLFQGHLGPKKAIILQETTCVEFSNIHGLSTIRFPPGHVSACFEEIRQVLERERIVQT